jgi:hypothetical protein
MMIIQGIASSDIVNADMNNLPRAFLIIKKEFSIKIDLPLTLALTLKSLKRKND